MAQQAGNGRPLAGFLVLGYAVTPLHPGVGRAPGAVDLPVQRDPMGYPMVYASSVKGALKAECAKQAGDKCFDDRGRIKCNDKDEDCALCCCLFGHEPEAAEAASSVLSVLDLVPLFFPVPSLSHGYLYITTPYLARRAYSVMEAIGTSGEYNKLMKLLENIAKQELGEGEAAGCVDDRKVYVGTDELNVKKKLGNCEDLSFVAKLGGLAGDIQSRMIVVSDAVGPLYVEKGLIRVTRVRLRLDTKTVAEGGLWTEEYIPQGTIFLSGFIAALPKKNTYCKHVNGIESGVIKDSGDLKNLITKLAEKLKKTNNVFYAIIGGKETVGRGLIKFTIALPQGQQ
ncbi:type III-B CRISPR module RAMP protein Cmr4 [Hyperthermus butylicus]|uniref:DNA repair (RAMP superfamily) n=1 Tax=Hyperthermus butylicus (strain DSM 5456 / JCM 9403 / PLM1-5) TaxID=415426 RepID=A2BKQ4_HYPBU|nr:type III-B CRISPR module RAMP protein Cmr4 [Hyperthermus butylicus]ABM80565.1 DNA repair (RAMP superfamily) [Hyperthermus butylicus DSM 5456]